MDQHYDVIVVGNQLSGVIAAGILAKQGRRVLLVDQGENAAHYRHGGVKLPLVPVLLPAFEASAVVSKVHELLGLGPELRVQTERLAPSFQAVLPNRRLDIHADREELIRELAAELPAHRDAIATFFARVGELNEALTASLDGLVLPPANMLERFRARRAAAAWQRFARPFDSLELLEGVPADHPLREVLLGPLTFFGHLTDRAPSVAHAVRLIALYFSGTQLFREPLGALAATLDAAAARAGVDLHRGRVVHSIATQGGRLTRLELEGDRGGYRSDLFLDNTAGGLAELLPQSSKQARLAAEEQSVRAVGSLLVLNLTVQRRVIPKGMARALFLLNGRRAPRDDMDVDPPLFVERYPIAAARGASSEEHEALEIVSAACPVRTQDIAHSPERLQGARQAMLARLRRLIPFLGDFTRDVSMPVDTTSWEADETEGERRVDPWRLHPIYEPGGELFMGVGARSPRTVFKNLLHSGRDTFPGLGIEGEYLAGKLVAEELTRLGGKKWRTKLA